MCTHQIRRILMVGRYTHCEMLHMYRTSRYSKAMAVRHAVRGSTAVCIQSQGRIWLLRASLEAIPTPNGALPGLSIGVFSTIAPRLIRKVVPGRSARNTSGGMSSSGNGQGMMCLIFLLTDLRTICHLLVQRAWMHIPAPTRSL